MSGAKYLSIGTVAVRIGVPESRLRRLCNRAPEKVPHARVGTVRAFREEDLGAIRQACVEAGLVEGTQAIVA